MKKSTKKALIRVNILVIMLLLGTLGILFFVLPKNKVSIVEKRNLSPIPYISWNKIQNGNFEKVLGGYIDSLDLYFSDNFPFRDRFVSLSFAISDAKGFKSKEMAFYQNEVVMNPAIEKNKKELPKDIDTLQTAEKIEEIDDELEEATASHGVMIYKKMAIQVFGGTAATCKYFSDVANQYRDSIPDSIQVYVAVTPTHGAYYLPPKYRKTSEIENIDTIYNSLKEGIHKIDIAGTLAKHTKEYIYFNTDHHWTGLGAYYAYTAFCKEANLDPIELKCHKRSVKNGFLGSLYWLTRDKGLEENQDSVIYYKPHEEYRTYAYTKKYPNSAIPTNLFAEYAKGPDSYGVYLGGDFPLMRVDTKKETKRRILILKNSYGNPFCTYMVPHFSRIYIIDYRHYEKNVLELIEKEKITDVVFFNNTFLANTIPHSRHFKKILEIPRSDQKTEDKSQ